MKKVGYKKAYSTFLLIMVALSAASVLYIKNLLVKYEASQPERVVEEQIELLSEAAAYGRLQEVLPLENYDPGDDAKKQEDISILTQKLRNSVLAYEQKPSVNGLEYNIICGDEVLARVALECVETKTRLIVFNFEKWEVKGLEAAIISKDIELPLSLGIKMNGEALTGTKNAETGMMNYSICSLTTPMLTLYDIAGNEAVFDSSREINTYGYKISVPSNYKVYANGQELSSNIAASAPIDEYEYVYEYCPQMPKQLTYDLHFLANDISFTITDNLGAEVPFEMNNRSVAIEGQVALPEIPDEIKAKIDVLDAAQQWSLFMTDDLKGKNHGYSTINKLLIEESYLQDVAWKWATGIDITLTSVHRLAGDTFTDEEVSEYIRYSDKCFSCKIKFNKHMIIGKNMNVVDTMDSTFYFVDISGAGQNPIWLIADIRENVSEGGAENE